MRGFIAVAFLLVAGVAWGQSSRAQELLERSMARAPVRNVRAIICQRLDYHSSIMEQVKVEMSTDGKLHQIVLAPLSLQGYEAVDDGTWSKTYLPDSRTLIVQASPKASREEAKSRMKLVLKNYRLKIERRERIAGRQAVVVAAEPVHKNLETRCYAIDEHTGFLLRLETCRPGAPTILHMETKFVEFPRELCDDVFELSAMGAKTKRYEMRSLSSKNLAREVGFAPAIPSSLPQGFVVQDIQTDTDSRMRSVALRLTDGLVRISVYQWQSDETGRSPSPEGTTVGEVGALRILVSGDTPDAVREEILRAFLAAAKSGQALGIPSSVVSWAQELNARARAFSLDRDPEAPTPFYFGFPFLIRL